MTAQAERPAGPRRASRPAAAVAAGILLSRILGLVRNRVFAHYFGTSAAADAFNAAFKIPNFLQNLFGEGVLSASFIPVYARLLAEENREEANRVAVAVGSLLALGTATVVLAGVILTPVLVTIFTPGFEGEKREATIRLARILFPGAGILVLSAWCLGVLNSHRRFFLSYAAPVVWNLAIIGTLLASGDRAVGYRLAEIAAWGSVLGSALQFGIQLPTVLRLLGRVTPSLRRGAEAVGVVLRNAGPVFVGRGVVQISAYVDTIIASLLPTGAVAGLSYAQVLYTLPVSLFGMSVSAAELPAMSSITGDPAGRAAQLRARLDGGLRQIAFFVVPSAVAFLALGDVIVGALYQTGAFTRAMTVYVWAILGGSAVGLLASTWGRLYASTYYALQDTRTPLRYGVIRVTLTIVLGYLFAIPLPAHLGLDPRWGAAGLTASAGMAGWVEYVLLRRTLERRLGPTGVPVSFAARLWGAAVVAALAAWVVKLAVREQHPLVVALFSLGMYGVTYFAVTAELRVPESRRLLARARRSRGSGS
ncbi:MAG TPA: murein biosynthesis integral membrane protein MurJ [Gemmatimonadales bacterium]|nr:murein biosynthesis integral membrane protein MurJ [Gemmatimonadales bacterium]